MPWKTWCAGAMRGTRRDLDGGYSICNTANDTLTCKRCYEIKLKFKAPTSTG